MFADLLQKALSGIAVLSPSQLSLLEQHFELLQRWNRVLNLTSLRDPKEIVERHYAESVFLALHLPAGPLRIVDIGSGAGFPGVPVAVVRPECSVTLVESHQRKAVFLRESSREIKNIRVTCARLEDVAEHFEWAVMRAVALSEVQRSAAAIASYLALLGGPDAPARECFTWNEKSPVPWGKQRYLSIGRSLHMKQC